MDQEYVVGVDVGTGSVRAGVFDLRGEMLSVAQRDIQIWRPKENFVEQSSSDIWSATARSVREAVRNAGITPAAVVGISFDATCSLVAVDEQDRPVTVSPDGDADRNIIVWMDHRAIDQTFRINARKHRVLRYVGGRISPEMQPPKLLWLKENLPDTWNRAARFFDLADFMTYTCTGIDIRSLCTTVCKWTYVGEEESWDRSFFRTHGMEDLLNRGKIGSSIQSMGACIGPLREQSAKDLGLTTRTKVAVGMIDAHAGGLGVMALGFDGIPVSSQLERVLALIGGTSSCHMAVSRRQRFIPGVWGPYYGAMIPRMWLTEGGQSATGSLLDFIIRESSQYSVIKETAAKVGKTIYQLLNEVVEQVQSREGKGPEIAKDIQILPYFHGNRSPRADPTLKGTIAGLTLDDTLETVARRYYATIQAIAYGTRHIIDELNRHGYRIKRIHACGGGTKNPLWLQEHADVTGCEIVLPKETEAVILGSAMLAAVGAGKYASILDAAVGMSSAGLRVMPVKRHARFHDAKYKVFHALYRHFVQYKKLMARW